jgi:hypothetical protein
MTIYLSVVLGAVFIFLILLSMIWAGTAGGKIEKYSNRLFSEISTIVLLLACFSIIGLIIFFLMNMFEFEMKFIGLGILIGIILYVPFATQAGLYSKNKSP